MTNLRRLQQPVQGGCLAVLMAVASAGLPDRTCASEPGQAANAAAQAPSAAEMKPYTEQIPGTDVTFALVPIPGGEFVMGSPEDEEGRNEDEGPQRRVRIEPFWMGQHEVTWDEYDIWSFNLDIQRRQFTNEPATDRDKVADAVTRPTKPYTDMTFSSGHDGYPAICMTHLAAKMYCRWLSEKTGHYYRLPTEAEWEYACRAGTSTPYSFGGDASKLGEYAWYFDNSGEERKVNYHKVGQKKPNPWGLYDMHGNVAEWCLDQYDPGWYAKLDAGQTISNPLNVAIAEYPRTTRGGSWYDDPEQLRSAARMGSTKDWKIQDPQLPQSIWYFTDATFVGFRVVRPLRVPSGEERAKLRLDPHAEELIPK
jgi:formylglycine-generating enzyme required for sulfatase activity